MECGIVKELWGFKWNCGEINGFLLILNILPNHLQSSINSQQFQQNLWIKFNKNAGICGTFGLFFRSLTPGRDPPKMLDN